ncbi:MAG: phosphatidate cytidylyltransferase [Acidimicrobiales bacterium]
MDDRDDRALGPDGELLEERGSGDSGSAGGVLGAAGPSGGAALAGVEGGGVATTEPFTASHGGTDGVRIAAVEAAVAAGLVPSTSRHKEARSSQSDDGAARGERLPVLELPDWSDPPTGQVPRILLGPDEEASGGVAAVRGPTWREDRADWDDAVDLSFLVEHEGETRETGEELEGARGSGDGDDAWAALLGEIDEQGPRRAAPAGTSATGARRRARLRAGEAGSHGRRHGAHSGHPGDRPDAPAFDGEPSTSWARRDRSRRRASKSPRLQGTTTSAATASAGAPPQHRSAAVATLTGLVVGGIALACFVAGPLPALVLVSVVVTLAAGEAFGALRRSGRRPATPLGLVAVPSLLVAGYLRGPQSVPVVLGTAVVLAFVWHLVASGRRPAGEKGLVSDLGSTLLVLCWVGLLGSFAGLLLDPTAFPHRHGVAYLAAVVACSAAADVGAYATGSLLGRHLLAPRVSPHKSVEGLVGGTVLALAVAGLAIVHLHPFGLTEALLLGIAVAILAPVGDLAESLVKRDLGLKDMGSLLPAHGGVLDRVDAMLFVLPAAYALVRVVHA